jgi:hypothetical protein
MKLYKDTIEAIAIHAAIKNTSLIVSFTQLKIEYKNVLKELIIEMQKEIDKIDNDLEL